MEDGRRAKRGQTTASDVEARVGPVGLQFTDEFVHARNEVIGEPDEEHLRGGRGRFGYQL